MGTKVAGVYRDSAGNAVASGTVTVNDAASSNLADIYSDADLSTAKANPFTADADGRFAFFAPPDAYKITASKSGFTSWSEDHLVVPGLPVAYNVTDYGVVSGGDATDNFTNLQRLIDLVPSGSVIEFPAGTFEIDDVLKDNDQDYVTIKGQGQATKIVGTKLRQTLFTIDERTGWEFRDLWLYGPGTGKQVTPDEEGCGIQFITCSHCLVHGCRFDNHGLHDGTDVGLGGVYWRESCTYCRVENCLFLDCNGAVLEDAFVNTATPYGNVILGNVSRRCRAHFAADSRGFSGGVDSGILIANNQIDGHASDPSLERYAIRIFDTRGAIVTGNHIRNVWSGIEVYADAESCTISNNTIINVSGAGVSDGCGIQLFNNPGATARKPDHVVISGNVIEDTSAHGIFCEDGTEVQIVGNMIKGAAGNGIRVALSRAGVVGNMVDQAVGHAIYVTGATCDNVLIVGNVLRGQDSATGLTADGIRLDATVGGQTYIADNLISNAAPTAGFKYGINETAGNPNVSWGFNRIINMGTAKYNPTTLRTEALFNPTLDQPMRWSNQSVFTTATAGAASALPATPEGYVVVNINGTNRKLPYYVT